MLAARTAFTCAFAALVASSGCSESGPQVSADAEAKPDADAATCQSSGLPARVWVGINDFPEQLMGAHAVQIGNETKPFRWRVPQQGRWTLQVHVQAPAAWQPCGDPVISCAAEAASGAAAVLQPPVAAWQKPPAWQKTDDGYRWSATVAAWDPATWVDTDGNALQGCSGPVTVAVDGVKGRDDPFLHGDLSAQLDPFDKVDNWLLDTSRDLGALEVTHGDGGFKVRTAKPTKPNGLADFDEALAALGLLGGDKAFNEAVKRLFRDRVRSLLRQFYGLDPQTGALVDGSVRVQFAFASDDALPDTKGWSVIAIGGDDPTWKPGGKTFFGRAWIDFHNKAVNDNTEPERGVFVTALARLVLEHPALSNLVVDYAPAAKGKPFGSLPGDKVLLDSKLDPKSIADEDQRHRAEQFQLITRFFGLAMGAVTGHEIGHSLGLVKPGFPPKGLLGGVTAASWMTSAVDDHHIDLAGMNIMQTGGSLKPQDLLGGSPYFAPFNLAYLRRQLVVDL